MIHRNVEQRLAHLAAFIEWDADPYMVMTDEGRLVWIVDGYTTSNVHPYSQPVGVNLFGERINYIRNAVKATVDAYHGTTTLYLFDESDPDSVGLRQSLPGVVQAVLRDAADDTRARPLSGDDVRYSGRTLSHVPHARSVGFLQQGRYLGCRQEPRGRHGSGRAHAPDIHRGDAAGRDRAGVPVDAALHAAQQRQPERLDGGAVRRRCAGRVDFLSTLETGVGFRAETRSKRRSTRSSRSPET